MMIDRNSKNISYPSQLGILLGLTGAGLIITVIATFVIWMVMVGGSFPTNEAEVLQPKYYGVNMVLQAVSTFFIFFAPVYFFAMICYRRPLQYLGYNSNISYRQVVLVIGILIFTFPLSGALGELNKILPIPQHLAIKFKAMETAREAQEAALIQINTFPKYVLSLFIIALLPAIFEETFFRAGMQQLFTRWFKGPWIAIILTSIIFSLIHLSYYGFLVRFGLGIILGLIFYYSRSLWINILFHFLFNGIQVTALYVMLSNNIKAKRDIEPNFPIWLGIIGMALIVYLFIVYKRSSEVQLAKYTDDDISSDDPLEWTRIQS